MARIAYLPASALAVERLPMWKRTMDVCISTALLALLSPLFLALSIFIKMVSPGPAFYKSQRVGFRGEEFTMWKFRSMHVNGSPDVHREHVKELIRLGKASAGQDNIAMTKLDADPRLIPMAHLLRKTCLDELPQLINVFWGEMSLVGPRPAIDYETDEYDPWHRGRLEAVPGMTGLWQVSGKNQLSFREMVALDITYSREMSLMLDLWVIAMTVPAIVGQIAQHLKKRRTDHV